ncbi:MAG: hypothetical protein A2019_01405 [Sulfurimonas sp. GWF2_37_8]|nr:MAG: hypothetical protein A2019_01405 [Sulfurimonas sp. GWF2_37_8]
MKSVLLLTLVLTFSSCAYKPSAKYSREVVGESISTSIIISSQDPENTVVIKDAMDSAVIQVFHASLSSRNLSKTHLEISINEPTYTPLQYDSNGFIVGYRATILLNITRYNEEVNKKYRAMGHYDFTVVANAVLTDQQRFDAIKNSAQKALKSFVAQISSEGTRVKNKE